MEVKLNEQQIDQSEGAYFLSVSKEQIEAHQLRSFKEILSWIESTNHFVSMVQTDVEKSKSRFVKEVFG